MKSIEIADKLRHAAALVKKYGLDRESLVCISVDAFVDCEIHIESAKFFSMFGASAPLDVRDFGDRLHVRSSWDDVVYVTITREGDELFKLLNGKPSGVVR